MNCSWSRLRGVDSQLVKAKHCFGQGWGGEMQAYYDLNGTHWKTAVARLK